MHATPTTLHGGTQLTLRTLREEYWIIGGRNLVKMHIRRCVICARQSARTLTQLMGNLPESFATILSYRRGLRRAVRDHPGLSDVVRGLGNIM
jgi:aminoglycoside N3'-acetyltransferase